MGTVRINGVDYETPDEGFRSLLTFLETDLGFTDMHYSCRSGQCGTCMLRVDGRWVKSCITPVQLVQGKEVLTQGELRRIQAEARAAREAAAAAEAEQREAEGEPSTTDADDADGAPGSASEPSSN